jgi:hypothetical protein
VALGFWAVLVVVVIVVVIVVGAVFAAGVSSATGVRHGCRVMCVFDVNVVAGVGRVT